MASHRLYGFGEFVLDPRAHTLRRAGRLVPIGSRAFDLLLALVCREGALAGRAELIAEAWPGQIVDDSNLATQIAALRRTIGDGEAGARMIVTVLGRGYRFTAPVTVREAAGAAPAARSGNLPVLADRFVGRVAERAALAERCRTRKLVTIVGPGGAGKTRLALALAASLQAEFADGVWFAEPPAEGDPDPARALCAAIGAPTEGTTPVEAAVRRLRSWRALLVLDGCETVLASAAFLADALGCACPEIRVLATSRERLRTAGESVFPLSGLVVEPAEHSEAAQLFMERAAAAVSGFAPDEAAIAQIATICRRLDGLPLAIELAARRLRDLPLDALEAGLGRMFGVLEPETGAGHGLRASLDRSLEGLTAPEREVLIRLLPHADGCTLAALGPEDWLDGIDGLVEKSVVVADRSGEATRYRLPEPMRQYLSQTGMRWLPASGVP